MTKVYVPTERQVLAHRARETFVLFGGAMGGGKTAWIVNEGIQLSLDYAGNVGFLCRWENRTFRATTYQQLMKFLPSELVKSHNSLRQEIELINGSKIWYGGLKSTGGTTSPLERLKSMELGWFGIDEASEVPEDVFLMLVSRLRLDPKRVRRYKGLLTSNPEPCWVKDRFIDNPMPDSVFISALPKDNPYLPADYIDNLRKMFPSEWVQRYIDGYWEVSSEGVKLFTWALLRNSLDLDSVIGDVYFGVDVARQGEDLTVVAGLFGNEVRILSELKVGDTMEVVTAVSELIERYNPTVVNIDSTGLGVGVFDRLFQMGYPVYEYIAGSRARDVRYLNRKTEDYYRLRELLQDGKIKLPDDKRLISELLSIDIEVVGDRRVRVKKGSKSPDFADAVVMAVSASLKLGGQVGDVGESIDEDYDDLIPTNEGLAFVG